MFANLEGSDFTIVSVAMDADVEAAKPWVEEASPSFVTLIDQKHTLSSLYNMVNVPQAVWINEEGQIVRPTETGGSLDILQQFDFETGSFPAEATARSQASKQAYVEAVRDWAVNGEASKHVLSAEQVRQRTPSMSSDMALAHAKFQLGQHLRGIDRHDEANAIFEECRALHPDSWNIFRETTEKMESGIAAGEAFWTKVMSLGDKPYYTEIKM